MSNPPKVLLFDIGGVCVISPFRAILDYEISRSIPPGWINHSIQSSSPNGSWQRLEKGEIPLDDSFFRAFQQDLTSKSLWRTFYAKHLSKTRDQNASDAAEEAMFLAPPVPELDAEWIYWEMMRISRSPDPWMFPALKTLRREADRRREGGKPGFLVGALSNTSIFPPGHEFNDPDTAAGKFNQELKSCFDVFVSSAHVGMRKPDVDIYEYAVRRLDEVARERGDEGGVKAEDIVFLDDIGTNLKTARKVGMRTVKVELGKAWKAVEELERIMGMKLAGGAPKL